MSHALNASRCQYSYHNLSTLLRRTYAHEPNTMEEQETAITNTMSLPIPVDREIDRVIAEIRTAWPYMKTDAVLGIERACKNMILNVVDTQ